MTTRYAVYTHDVSTRYTIDEQGRFNGSDSWKLLGAVELNNFGYEVRRYSLKQVLENPSDIPWQWKNGKQRTHVIDLDHGTRRVWMNPAHIIY